MEEHGRRDSSFSPNRTLQSRGFVYLTLCKTGHL